MQAVRNIERKRHSASDRSLSKEENSTSGGEDVGGGAAETVTAVMPGSVGGGRLAGPSNSLNNMTSATVCRVGVWDLYSRLRRVCVAYPGHVRETATALSRSMRARGDMVETIPSTSGDWKRGELMVFAEYDWLDGGRRWEARKLVPLTLEQAAWAAFAKAFWKSFASFWKEQCHEFEETNWELLLVLRFWFGMHAPDDDNVVAAFCHMVDNGELAGNPSGRNAHIMYRGRPLLFPLSRNVATGIKKIMVVNDWKPADRMRLAIQHGRFNYLWSEGSDDEHWGWKEAKKFVIEINAEKRRVRRTAEPVAQSKQMMPRGVTISSTLVEPDEEDAPPAPILVAAAAAAAAVTTTIDTFSAFEEELAARVATAAAAKFKKLLVESRKLVHANVQPDVQGIMEQKFAVSLDKNIKRHLAASFHNHDTLPLDPVHVDGHPVVPTLKSVEARVEERLGEHRAGDLSVSTLKRKRAVIPDISDDDGVDDVRSVLVGDGVMMRLPRLAAGPQTTPPLSQEPSIDSRVAGQTGKCQEDTDVLRGRIKNWAPVSFGRVGNLLEQMRGENLTSRDGAAGRKHRLVEWANKRPPMSLDEIQVLREHFHGKKSE